MAEIEFQAWAERRVRALEAPAGASEAEIAALVQEAIHRIPPKAGDIIRLRSGKLRVVIAYQPEFHTLTSHCTEHVIHQSIRDGKPWGATRSSRVAEVEIVKRAGEDLQ
jgi:hypothetical protein